MYVSLFRVPESVLPVHDLPLDARPILVLGQAVVATAWAVYEPEGVLAYSEVLAARRVRLAGRSFTTVTGIWVDSMASLAGARALWSIPKQLASFDTSRRGGTESDDFRAEVRACDRQPIAALRYRGRMRLPGRWRVGTSIVQLPLGEECMGHGAAVTQAKARARIEFGTALWDFVPDGPLGYMSGRTPLASARLSEMSLCFGGSGPQASERSSAGSH